MPINWIGEINPRSDDPEWSDKEDDRLYWRGRNTGMWHGRDTQWRLAQRTRLVDLALKGYEHNVTVLRPKRDESDRVGTALKVKRGRYAPALLDFAFISEPVSCEDHTCDELQRIFEFRMPHNARMAGRYKYIMDVSSLHGVHWGDVAQLCNGQVDGNGWSSRFKRLITSNSLVFKSTVYPEW